MMTAHQVGADNPDEKGETGMPNGRSLRSKAVYEIRVMGRLDPSWSDWFDNMTITYQDAETTLLGAVADQAALLGVLTKLSNLNLALVSVTRLGGQAEQPAHPKRS
jgi:hypothetical protein